ncbi:hypothetical protein MHYP_G00312040 [Metynnis hypsauchen]
MGTSYQGGFNVLFAVSSPKNEKRSLGCGAAEETSRPAADSDERGGSPPEELFHRRDAEQHGDQRVLRVQAQLLPGIQRATRSENPRLTKDRRSQEELAERAISVDEDDWSPSQEKKSFFFNED